MNKKQLTLGAILFTAFIFVFVYKSVFSIRPNKETTTYNSDIPQADQNEVPTKTPEQVLQELKDLENPQAQGPLSAKIVSPQGKTFSVSQARLYNAEIENAISSLYKDTDCNWKFYLDENNEEILYREQTVPVSSNDHCGFTSTFIDKRGKLRVLVEVVISDEETGEVLDTYSAEKEYTVQ